LAPGEPPAASGVCQNFDNAVKQAGLDLGDGALLDICQDYWPFDWSKVNIPGSPGLSRLFRGLELESASHIPPISLDEPEADDPPCLSKSELQDLVYGSKETSNASFHPARASRVQRYSTSTALEKSSAGRDPQYPWRNIERVFCGYATSPLTEIYVFPSTFPPDHSRKPFHPVMPLRSEFQRRETELKAKFGKLKKRLPADNPAVVAVMEDLAFVFFELDKFNKAESMYRKLVNLYRLTLGPNHATTLEACQKVIESLRQQGQYSKAKSLNDTLRSATSKLVQAHHPLAIRIAMNDAWLSELLGQNEEAERVRREILQIMLTHYGPRHFISMYALSVLGYSISTRGGEDGEKLLRTALQLSLEDPDGEPSYYTTICTILDLASALQAKGAYEESLSISTNAVERFTPLLGSTHPLIRGLNERRAWSLLRTGILVESEKLFRDLVAFYSVGKVETRGTDLANAWFGFANVLSKMGRLGDAIGWYEKCFQFSVTSYGANHKESIALCYQFADCYEEQGRFDDALSVFRQMIHKLRASGQDSEDAILDLGSEIERIEQKMEQEASFSSNSDREGSEYESDSDDKNLNKETSERENEKVDERHVDATKGQGEAEEGQSEPEDDDWKSFLHDDFRTL
jgi:pentatricopeptide repeat protein